MDMRSFEEVDMFGSGPIPDLFPLQQLHLFSGQSYFRNFEDYNAVCNFLSLYIGEPIDGETTYIDADGFVVPGGREVLGMDKRAPFKTSPVNFIRAIMRFRHKSRDYTQTHVGKMLSGTLLQIRDFEELGADDSDENEADEDVEMTDADAGAVENAEGGGGRRTAPEMPLMRCVRAFTAADTRELSMRLGEVFVLTEDGLDGWVEVSRVDSIEVGWVPQ